MKPPQILILAGPNGAGKSTFASRYIKPGIPFVNADNIAREMDAPPGRSTDLAAGRVLLRQLAELEREHTSFALETNLANHTLASRIPRWRSGGYEVSLYFVWVPSADLAVERVAQRVRSGGHDIPEETIRRRYRVGIRFFFEMYQPLVNNWRLYDNSSMSGPVLVAHSLPPYRVTQRAVWERIRQEMEEQNAGAER